MSPPSSSNCDASVYKVMESKALGVGVGMGMGIGVSVWGCGVLYKDGVSACCNEDMQS